MQTEKNANRKKRNDIRRLIEIIAILRTPKTGCPWDLAQNFSTIAIHTIEEAYEVVDAIERNNMEDLCNELGDLLLQVIFHAQIASETGLFEFADVVEAICNKMIFRHPHIFGNAKAETLSTVNENWEKLKTLEKNIKKSRSQNTHNTKASLLDNVPAMMPALTVAVKLHKEAAKIGFDWKTPKAVLDKLKEELYELNECLVMNDKDGMENEIGDLLFTIANLAHHLEIDPEKATRRANKKFCQRFAKVEQLCKNNAKSIMQIDRDTLESYWEIAKKREKK